MTDRASQARRPAVVVQDVHVEYRVHATGTAVKGADARGGLLRRSRSRSMRTVHALRGVSFTAWENESIGVIGSNGSGKSTLMRALTGLTPTAQGAIYAASRPHLLGVGAALVRDLPGSDNVMLGGLAMGLSRTEVENRYDEVVDFAGLREFIDLPMRTYSSGMTARLKFAIATANDHDILIVDEALAVGDKSFRSRSEARMREIRDRAGTVFLVSHSMSSIRDTCERVLWLERGRLVADGPTAEVLEAYADTRS